MEMSRFHAVALAMLTAFYVAGILIITDAVQMAAEGVAIKAVSDTYLWLLLGIAVAMTILVAVVVVHSIRGWLARKAMGNP